MTPSRLTAWLVHPPEQATRLELRHEALSGPQTLASWTRAELDAQTAAETLLMVAQDHCEELERRAKYDAVWLDHSDRVLLTKPIRCEPEAEPELGAVIGSGVAPREDPNMGGLVSQLMRHVENRERLLNIALGTNLKLLADQVRDARGEADALRAENRVLRQRARKAEEEGLPDVEAEARAEAVTKLSDVVVTHIVPLVAARLREGLQ